MDPPVVVDNPREHRFEVAVDGHVAQLTYRRRRGELVLRHTGVPDELEGRGIAGALVRTAIDDARERGLTVIPRCPFASSWLRRHPEVAATVEIDWPLSDADA